MNVISTLLELLSTDLEARKNQILGTSIANFLVAIFVFLAMGMGSVALVLWLAKTFDMVIALLIVAALYLVLAALTIVANKIYQQRQERKKADAEAMRNLYLSSLLTGVGKSNLLTLAGVALASFLSAKK